MLVFMLQSPDNNDSGSNSGSTFTEKEMDHVRNIARDFSSNNDKIGIHLCCIIERLFNAKNGNKESIIPDFNNEIPNTNKLNDPDCHVDIAFFLQLILVHKAGLLHEASHQMQPVLANWMFGGDEKETGGGG